MARVLLHACCAVCASHPYFLLKESGYDVTLYFYNPNIYPDEEYQRRLNELKKFASINNIRLIIEEKSYDYWLKLVKGYENEPEKGNRCTICFKERLFKAHETALKENFDFYTTTLTVSPHKNSKQVFEAAKMVTENNKTGTIPFLEMDFKKQNGFLKASKLANEYGFYRQKYCGCEFSIR